MIHAAMTPSPWINVQVLLTLAVILAASSVTFWVLVRRSTSHRNWVSLAEWCQENGFHIQHCSPEQLPAPLGVLIDRHPVIRLCLATEQTVLVQVETASVPVGSSDAGNLVRWNLLVRRIETSWRPTGMRPANASHSVLDLHSLSSFPLFGSTERFLVFGADSADARVLSVSMARSLLPPDVGLLLLGTDLVLDFSQRPFDTIEFNRMLALADQLVQKLPAPM